MPTFTQAILLGAERLNAAPSPPHAVVADAWASLGWTDAKETALLEASALIGVARAAGANARAALPASTPAPAETQPLAPPAAVVLLRRLLGEEWRVLLPEWLEHCANHGARVPPFFLRTLFEIVTAPADRALLLRVVGERGRWLAAQNPEWAWVAAAAAPEPDLSLWETGSEDERLASLRHARRTEPGRATEMLAQTWADDPPEFRSRVLAIVAENVSPADESLLLRALADRRKEIRAAAQALLATLPTSGLAGRMQARAETLLTLQRGLLGRKLEINLPAAFDPSWKADAIEEKPPTGVGEKAHWTQQILGLVPVAYWSQKFGVDPGTLVSLAAKSGDWTNLLLGAWFRAACVHREADASAALVAALSGNSNALPPGMHAHTAANALLNVCRAADRWRIVAGQPELAWTALGLLTGTPSLEQGRALLENLAPALRDGFNPGGSPGAVLAARRIPPELRELAAQRLRRDDGYSKPAETFLAALKLRAELHTAFSHPPRP